MGTTHAALATPTVQSLSDSHGKYYLVNNGVLGSFQLYTTGALAGKITSIVYDGKQMVGSKGLYYDVQGTPGIYLGSGEQYSVRTGSNFIDISAVHPATATEPLEVTWHWILKDNDPAFSTYLTYHHTTAMANYSTNEQRLGAEFFNDNLFHYSSITDNDWGRQAAGDPVRDQGRYITDETADMRGIPSEYAKSYETKYDWRSTYAESGGVTGIVTAANTSAATGPKVADDYGIWSMQNYRGYESWNAGPTHPQTPVADGASIIPSPSGSHFGGPGTTFVGNMDKSIGPVLTYFNKGTDINSLRSDAKQQIAGDALNNFYDSLNLPYYATAAQRGTVTGKMRIADGQSLEGATIILSDFNAPAYASDPLSQEYQRHVNGYNYWVTPNKDGTFTMPDVRPGTYRVTVIKPGVYREGSFDNIVVTAGNTTSAGNLTFVPDINGKPAFQIGSFDRTAGEFKHGNEYNNWLDTFSYAKDFPSGVNLTVNPSNPTNDTQNWANNWGLNQASGTQDFWAVNFTLASAPAANSTVTLTVAIADQMFINDLAALVYNAAGTSYNRVDASFDHTADNAPATYRSGDTSSRVLYRKLTIPASWLHVGNNKIAFHIVGGQMQWDAVRLDIQNSGTFYASLFNGGSGNWSDASKWSTQGYGYTNITKGSAGIANDTSTTFADGATAIAPINNVGLLKYYDAFINGGNITLDTSPTVQRFSLLDGTLAASASNPTLTVNDAFALAGGTFTGAGSIAALSTTTVSFANTIAGGAKVISSGAVTWADGASLNLTDSGSRWTLPGVAMGQTASSTLTIGNGASLSITGGGSLSIGAAGVVSVLNSSISGTISNAGSFSADATSQINSIGGFTNSGSAVIDGALAGSGVTNNVGLLVLNGTNSYTGNTTINAGAVKFGSLASIGGSGASIFVKDGGAVAFSPGATDAGFLSRIHSSSTGALALTSADAATNLDFTSGALAPLANMGIGAVDNVTYTGIYTPAAGSPYRLGGGGGALNFTPAIAGTASVIIGNNGSSGSVTLNAANSYSGITTIKGGVLAVQLLANGGAASPIGSSDNSASNLVIDGGALASTGAATTDRLFTIGANGATLDGSGGALNFTNTGVLAASGIGNRTLVLAGTNGANVLVPALADPASGKTSLTKIGTGIWTLGNALNSYSGDTTILEGALRVGGGAVLPAGAGKGNLAIGTSGIVDLNGQNLAINALNDGPAPATGWTTSNGPGGGALGNAIGTRTLTVGNNNASGLFSGVISGGLNLIKTGSGTQILSGDNTYSGTTTITAGVLQIGVGGIPLSTGPGDGGFRGMLGTGNVINNSTLLFSRGYYTTATNQISGSGTLRQIANAELVLGAANTYTGATIIGSGTPNIGLGGPSDGTGLAYTGDSSINASVLANGGVASSIGASSNSAGNLILDGGTLFSSSTGTTTTDRLFTVTQNGGALYISGTTNFSNSGAIVMSGVGDRTLSLGGDAAGGGTFNSDIGDPTSGKTSLTKDRSTTWTITSNAALTYSGNTNILMGTLKLGTGAALPFGAGKGDVVFGTSTDFNSDFPAVLEMNGNNLSINGLSGGGVGETYWKVNNSGAAATLSVGNGNASATYNGLITGTVNVVKTGTGTETFDRVSMNSGNMLVNSGKVVLASHTTANSSAGTSFFRKISIASAALMDTTNNAVVIDLASTATTADQDLIRTQLADGRLFSSTAGTNRLGFRSNANVASPAGLGLTTLASFGGVTVDSSSILIRVTYAGDTNLDGRVDAQDLFNLASGWFKSGEWQNGDFNYDGIVNGMDLGLLSRNWQAGVTTPLAGEDLSQELAEIGLPNDIVPEPAAITSIAIAAAAIGSRRRRK